ncbi:MAG TPA: L,D-transpeptidase family protein [Thermoanaerobaculia bacterium]|nr:L,D-transpeptidase family protein [Thermoanaerobaculia bacterium]
MLRRFLLALLIAVPAFAQTVEAPPATPAARVVQAVVEESQMPELRWPDFSDYRKHLRNFYAPTGYRLVWTANGKPTAQARATIALFEAADVKGIHAVDYDGGRWAARVAALRDDVSLARFDVAMTATLMRYISDLHIGRINPRNIRFELDIESKKYYLPKVVADVAAASDPAAVLANVEPQYADYRRLQTALARYRQIAIDSQNEKPLPAIAKLQRGETYAALPQLARMLQRFGDLAADAKVDGTTYDGAIVEAVKHFQVRHGLDADGVISAKTLAQLNVPAARRVKQLEWALERWRWAPLEFSAPPIIVNVPEFRLRAWNEKQETALTMRVVVGQAYTHETPIFDGDMKVVVFRPYWSVPPSIQRKEIAPKLERDPGWLARNHYELVDAAGASLGSSVDNDMLRRIRTVDVRIRQQPGGSNALGLVKFLFPNQNNVYLHSTPSQALFSKSRRDFSHGCIRVEDPVALAAWVLRDQPQWTTEKIRATMNGDRDDMYVTIPQPIPVIILYTTAVVFDNGDVHFFEDIYGHDATLENALAAGYPYPA